MPSALVGRPGEDVEAVVSMLLCRRHERAARRRAGRGDRGVDVFVPVDRGRIDVYQVKRYDRSLTAAQWRKIKESYDRLVEAVAEGHVAVLNWYLVMPLDQSEADAAKFAQLVASAPFERCEWKGLAWLDALASEYPEVVDYYLADGKARLEEAHCDLMAVLGARASASDGADAGATTDGLTALHRTLNRRDPLYRYDFAVGSVDDRDAFVPAEPPGSLVFTVQLSDGDVCVTWHVHARCDESVRERPIPIGLRLDADQDPTLPESLRLFADYGKPFSAPHGTVTISLDLPGGLGGTRENGSVRIGPTAEEAAHRYVMRLRAVGSDGAAAAPVRLEMSAPTVGARGTRLYGEHDGGAFTVEVFHDFEPATMNIRFSALDPTGRPVVSVLDGVEFLHAVAGSSLEVAAEHGPFMAFGDVGTHDGKPEQRDEEPGSGEQAVLEALRALAAMQAHTTTTLLVPDRMTRGDACEWQNVARILAGEIVVDPRLGELRTELQKPPGEPLDGEHAFAVISDLAVRVGKQHVVLGKQALQISAARVLSDPGRPGRLTVTPRPGASWTRTRAGAVS